MKDGRFVVSKIVDAFFELDNPKDFAVWFELNCANLKEEARKELIEAHSEGITQNYSGHNLCSILWFQRKYGFISNEDILGTAGGSLPSKEIESQVLNDYLDWYDRHELANRDGNAEISEYLIDKFVSGR